MMKILSSMALAATIALGCAALAGPAAAAPVPGVVAGMTAGTGAPVEDVRWVNRCRPQTVARRNRYGRPVRVTREVCRRVWIDQRGGRGRY
jgi:ABC-type sugar transport system substrate-binding protein